MSRDRGDLKRVVITGAAGLIGSIVARELHDSYVIHRTDRRGSKGISRVDTKRRRAAIRAFAGNDAVVDLAATAETSAPWRTVIGNNIRATANAFEAARTAGIKRVVYASSNHVTGWLEKTEPYRRVVEGRYEDIAPDDLPRIKVSAPTQPDSPYAIGKAFGEAAARYYSDEFDLSVICLRIGTVNAEDRPTTPREFATLLTHRDLVHLVDCCLQAPSSLRFGVYYGVSNNRWRIWDITNAEAEIGYRPLDDAEVWRERHES